MKIPLIPDNVKRNVIGLAIGLMVVSAVVFVYRLFASRPAPVGGYVAALPAHGMSGAPTHSVTLPVPLRVIDKAVAAKKIKLPPEIVSDPKKELVNTTSLKPSAGGYTTATMVDTTTGIADTVWREEKRSLFGFGGGTEIGVRGGLSTKGQQAAVYARQDVLRVGSIHLAGYGEVNAGTSAPEAKAMVDVSYRW